jgi:hypothetical protein
MLAHVAVACAVAPSPSTHVPPPSTAQERRAAHRVWEEHEEKRQACVLERRQARQEFRICTRNRAAAVTVASYYDLQVSQVFWLVAHMLCRTTLNNTSLPFPVKAPRNFALEALGCCEHSNSREHRFLLSFALLSYPSRSLHTSLHNTPIQRRMLQVKLRMLAKVWRKLSMPCGCSSMRNQARVFSRGMGYPKFNTTGNRFRGRTSPDFICPTFYIL